MTTQAGGGWDTAVDTQDHTSDTLGNGTVPQGGTQAAGLRKLAETESLTEQGVVDFLRNPKPSGPKTVSIGRSLYYTYFKPGTSKQEVERVIGKALALYFGQPKGESA